jgi:flagellar protein FlbD
MIKLTRLDNSKFIVNCDLIEFIEEGHNTIITLRTNKKIHVRESVDDILSKVISYKQLCFSRPYYTEDNKVFINSNSPDNIDDTSLDNVKDIIDSENKEDE